MAGADVSVGSVIKTTVAVATTNLAIGSPGGADLVASVTQISSTSRTTIESGASITSNNGSITVSANATKNFGNTAAGGSGSDGLALVLALTLADTTSDALVLGTLHAAKDVDVTALIHTIADKTTATSIIGDSFFKAVVDPIKAVQGTGTVGGLVTGIKNLLRLSPGPSALEKLLGGSLSAATDFAKDSNTTTAEIGSTGRIAAGGKVDVDATTIDAMQTAAISEVKQYSDPLVNQVAPNDPRLNAGAKLRTHRNAYSAAVSLGLFENDTEAHIDANAVVNATDGVTVNADTDNPYHPTWWSFSDPVNGNTGLGSVGTSILDKLNENLGLQSGFFTSWAQAAAVGQDKAVAFSVNVFQEQNTTKAYIDNGASINQDSSFQASGHQQNVAVTAETTVDTVNLSGAIRFFLDALPVPFLSQGSPISNSFFGTSAGATGIGAAGFALQYDDTTLAYIGTGAKVNANNLTVEAITTAHNVAIAMAGGSAGELALDGTLNVVQIDNNTDAHIGAGATIVALGNVYVHAKDDMLNVDVAGSAISSDNQGVGISVGVNLVTRNTSAYIGYAKGATIPAGAARLSLTAGGDVTIRAETDGLNVGFAVAGTISTPNEDDPPSTPEISSWTDPMFDLGLPPVTVVEANTGVSASGSAIVNVETDTDLAYVNEGASASPEIKANSLTLASSNTNQTVSVSGAVAFTSSGFQSSVGMAGAFGANAILTTTDAFISGANVQVNHLSMDADRSGVVGSITAGFAGAVRPVGTAAAVLGSVSVNIVIPHTDAYVTGATLSLVGDSHVKAADSSIIWAVTGGSAYGSTAGVGAAIDVNLIGSSNQAVAADAVATTEAYITRSTVTMVGGTLEVAADNSNPNTDPRIIAVSYADGVGTQPTSGGVAGMISVNVIKYDTEAYLAGGSSVKEVAAPSGITDPGAVTLNVHADDTSGIVSIGGAVGTGAAVGVGAALGFNQIHDTISAYFDNADVTVTGPISLTASSTQKIGAVTIGVAAGTGKGWAAAGSVSVDNITDSVDAHISNTSNVQANGSIQLQATDSNLVVAITGGVGASVGGAAVTGAGAGVAISYTLVSDAVTAYVDDSTVTSVGSGLSLAASSTSLVVAIDAAGGGSTNSIGGAGSIAINSVANSVDAHITDSTITTLGDLLVSSSEAATLYAFSLAVGLSGEGGGVGAVLAYNYIGGVIDPADPNVISYDDGAVSGTKDPQVSGDNTTATSNITAYIDGSSVQSAGKITVTAGLANPDQQPTSGPAVAQTVTVDPSTVTLTTDTIQFASAHGLQTGDQVLYHNGGGASIGGLTDATTYYVIRVDDKTIKLAATQADALAGKAINLTGAGTSSSDSFTLASGTVLTFNPSTAIVLHNANEDTLGFTSDPHLKTGDTVVYHNGGGTSIGGLVDGEIYYVIRIDSTHFQLALTQNDALADSPQHILLTSRGSGSNQTLVQKTSEVDVGVVSVPLLAGLGGQIVAVTGAGAAGNSSGAGSVGLNFVRTVVDAHISNTPSGGKVQANGSILVEAADTSKVDTGVGSFSITTGSGIAVNASVGVNDIKNSVAAHVDGAKVQSSAGSVSIQAIESARSVNIVVGGGGAADSPLVLGGSIAVDQIHNNVDAHIKSEANGSSDVEANKAILVQAVDSEATASLAGNVAANIGGVGAVGLAFAVNTIGDTVTATIDNSIARAAGGNLTVDAEFVAPTDLPPGLDVQIAAMAVSGGGAADIAGAGSVSLNWIKNKVLATISNIGNLDPATGAAEISASGNLNFTASDHSTINSLAGAVAIAGIGAAGASGAIGASVADNYLGGDPNATSDTSHNVVQAAIENVTGTIRAAAIDVAATYAGQINNITVAGAGAGAFALGGAVSINIIKDTADAQISGSTDVNATGTSTPGIQVAATDNSSIAVLAGGVGVRISAQTGSGLAAGVSVASNDINNTTQAFIDSSKVTSASDVELTATSTPNIEALTIGVAIAASASAMGGLAGSGAGSGSGNTIADTVQAYISARSGANLGVFANGGAVAITATDSPTVEAAAGSLAFDFQIGGGGLTASVGISVAINDVEDKVFAYIDDSTVTATSHDVDLSAKETAVIKALTIGGAIAVGVGGSGAGVGAAGAGSGNTVKNQVYAYVQDNSTVTTVTSGSVSLIATDNSKITADGGGISLAGEAFTSGAAVSLGVAAANNDIENIVKTNVDTSTVKAATGVSLSASETAIITTLSIGGAVGAALAAGGGAAVVVAGADSENTIKNQIYSYVSNSKMSKSQGVFAGNGSVSSSATDNASIVSNAGGAGIAVAGGAQGGLSLAVGFGVAHNKIANTVEAYIDGSDVSATSGDVSLTTQETSSIKALSIGAALALAAGGNFAASAAGSGGSALNTFANTVEAFVDDGSSVATTTSGNILISASDSAFATAETVATSISASTTFIAGAAVSVAAALGDNEIGDMVKAFSDSSDLNSAGAIHLQTIVRSTGEAMSVAAAFSASAALASLALTGAGADSENDVHNTVQGYIQGASSSSKSTITAAGLVAVDVSEIANVDAQVGSGAIAIGVIGGSIGISTAENKITSSIKSYIDNATVTSTGGAIALTALSQDSATTLGVATSLAAAVGGGIAGAAITVNVSPTIEAYTGSNVTLKTPVNFTVLADSLNSAQGETVGASGGLTAIGSSNATSTASGSVSAHVDGPVPQAANVNVLAGATNTSDASATAVAGGLISGSGAEADAVTSPAVSAFIGNVNVTTSGGIQVAATVTPKADATVHGVAAGLVAVGASIARAPPAPTGNAYLGGSASTFTPMTFTVAALMSVPTNDSSTSASAVGSSGSALLGVNATTATATNSGTVTSFVAAGTKLVIENAINVTATGNSQQRADGNSVAAGILAAGSNFAGTTSNANTSAYLGKEVTVNSGADIGGLTSGNTYYVVVLNDASFAPTDVKVSENSIALGSNAYGLQNGDLVVYKYVGTKTIGLIGGLTNLATYKVNVLSDGSVQLENPQSGVVQTLITSNADSAGQSLFLLNPRLVSLAATLNDALADSPNVFSLGGSKASGAEQTLTPLGAFGSSGLAFDPTRDVLGNAIDVGPNNQLLPGEPVVYGRSVGATLNIAATGNDNALASSTAGSGGLVAGAGAQSTTNNNTTTQAYIADDAAPSSTYTGIQVSALTVNASHLAEFDSQTNTTQATAVGFSGSWANDNDNSNTYATIGAGADITAQSVDVAAPSTTTRERPAWQRR